MKKILLTLFLVPSYLLGQTNQSAVDTIKPKAQFDDSLLKSKIEKPLPFEISAFKKAGLLIPKIVKRFYNYDNADTINYLSVAIYPTTDYLIKGDNDQLYRYYDVSFSGSSENISISYSYSVGRGYSCQGSYFVEAGVSLQTDYGYGTSSGTLIVIQNGKIVYSRKILQR